MSDDTGIIPSNFLLLHSHQHWQKHASLHGLGYFFSSRKKFCWQISREKYYCIYWSTLLFNIRKSSVLPLDFLFSTSLPSSPCFCQHICWRDVTLTYCLPGGQEDTVFRSLVEYQFFFLLSVKWWQPSIHSLANMVWERLTLAEPKGYWFPSYCATFVSSWTAMARLELSQEDVSVMLRQSI